MSQSPNMQQAMELFSRIMSGDKTAMVAAVNLALPKIEGYLDTIEEEIEYRREHEWMDETEARRLAIEGDVPPDQAVGAFSDLHSALLRVTSRIPIALVADDQHRAAAEEMLIDALYSFILTASNPVVRYGIVGGMHPDVREDAADYVERMAHELWATLRALTDEGEIDRADFPRETANVIEAIAEEYDEGEVESRMQTQASTQAVGEDD